MKLKINFIVIFTLCLFFKVSAQNILFPSDTIPTTAKSNYRTQVETMFGTLNLNAISSGILKDYGIEFNELDYHTGVLTDSIIINVDYWRSIYATLFTGRINNTASNMPTLKTINTAFENYKGGTIELATQYYTYQEFKPNAVNTGLINYISGKLYDISGSGNTPYNTKEVFATVALDPISIEDNVSFIFKSDLFYTNTGKTIQSIQLNASDGNGYQSLYINTPFSIYYSTNGYKEITLKITFTDNSTRYSSTRIFVESDNNSSSRVYNDVPDHEELITAVLPYNGADGNLYGSATLQIGYGDDGVLSNPMIIVEGFDPENEFDFDDIVKWNRLGGLDYNLQNTLEQNDYDIVFVNFTNGAEFVQRNAYVVEEAIKWVNLNKVGNNQNVVMGISMGGLVARYALRDMEDRSLTHDTRLYVSMDSPHQGANVPLGVQAMVFDLATYAIQLRIPFVGTYDLLNLSDISPGLGEAMRAVRSPAAVQMLEYQVTKNSNGDIVPLNNPYRTAFKQEYALKGYPQNCRNIAISNGSECAKTDLDQYELVFESDCILDLPKWAPLAGPFAGVIGLGLSPWFPNISNLAGVLAASIIPFGDLDLEIDFKVWTLPNQQVKKIYNGEFCITKNLFWFIPITSCIFNSDMYSQTSHLPFDNAPGGITAVSQFANGLPDDLLGCPIDLADQFCFIPTTSSLDVNGGNITTTDIYKGYSPNDNSINTPFANFKTASKQNEPHTLFSQSNSDWLWKEISGNPEVIACHSFCLELIEGDDVICANTTETYLMPDVPTGLNIYYWDITGSATQVSTTSNSINLQANSNNPSNHLLTLKANISGVCGVGTAIREDIWMGKAGLSSKVLDGDHITYPNQFESYIMPMSPITAAKSGVTSYAWNTPSGWTKTGTIAGGNGQSYKIGTTLGNYTVSGTAYNKCGSAPATKLVIVKSYSGGGNPCRSAIKISPNPASSKREIIITYIPPTPPCDPGGGGNTKQALLDYDILSVMDNYGNIVYQTKPLQEITKILTYNFRKGIYMITYQKGSEILESKFVIE